MSMRKQFTGIDFLILSALAPLPAQAEEASAELRSRGGCRRPSLLYEPRPQYFLHGNDSENDGGHGSHPRTCQFGA